MASFASVRFRNHSRLQMMVVNGLAQAKVADGSDEHVACSAQKDIVTLTAGLRSVGDNTSGGCLRDPGGGPIRRASR